MSYKTELLKLTNAYFHIYNRGANRNRIFYEPENYLYFLRKLKKYRDEFAVAIIAYCLMPNHFHLLLLQKTAGTISGFMKLTTNSYAKALNKRQQRTGHLFESNYKLKRVESDVYLIHLSRYLHINPVKDKLVQKPEDWAFSSYRDFIGLRNGTLPEPEVILDCFASAEEYIEFVNAYSEKDIEKIKKYI